MEYYYNKKSNTKNIEQEIEDLKVRINYMSKMMFYNKKHEDFVDELTKLQDEYENDLVILEAMLDRRIKNSEYLD